jgi:hypothetical protein
MTKIIIPVIAITHASRTNMPQRVVETAMAWGKHLAKKYGMT